MESLRRRQTVTDEVFVIKSIHSECLLSFSTAQELGLVTLHLATVSASHNGKNTPV